MKEYFQGWFYRKHIAVIAFHERSIRLIELKKQRHGIKCIKIFERKWDAGMSQNEQPELELLKHTAAEFNLSRLKTIIQLPQHNLRHHLLKLPAGINGQIEDWLEQNSAQFLPPGLPGNQLVYGYQHIHNTENSGFVLLSIAKLDAIRTWTDVFRTLHLRVAGLNGNYCSIQNGFAFLYGTFFQENWAFLHFDTKCVFLMITQKGNLVRYQEFFRASHDVKIQNHANIEVPDKLPNKHWQELIEKELSEYKRDNALHQIILTGDSVDQTCESKYKNLAEVKSGGGLLKSLLPVENSDKYVHLFGLGVQYLYGQFETNDLRPEEFKQEIKDEEQKIQTIHFAGYFGLILVSIWLILIVTNFFVKLALSSWETEVTKLDKQIKQIEELKNAGRKLSSQFMMHKDLLNQRSRLAHILFDISKIMPEGVWLRTIRYGKTEDAAADFPLIIEGLALAEQGPTKLLADLERLSYLNQVQLDFMQSVPAEIVWKKTKLRRIPLFKFKLSAASTN